MLAGYFFFVFLSGRCVSADPAEVLESLPVRLSLSTLDAAFPALLPVFSFFATANSSLLLCQFPELPTSRSMHAAAPICTNP